MVLLDISDKGRLYAKTWSYFRARRGVEGNELICVTAADRAGRRAEVGPSCLLKGVMGLYSVDSGSF